MVDQRRLDLEAYWLCCKGEKFYMRLKLILHDWFKGKKYFSGKDEKWEMLVTASFKMRM